MSSSGTGLGKSLSASVTTSYTPAGAQTNASSSFEASRRQSQNPSHSPQAIPRKSQGSRRQHRNQRRAGNDEDDEMAEIRAVRNASSRRGQTSITHLMNYTLPPRSYHDYHHGPPSRSYRRNPSWGIGSGHHAADKTRYVHANYRFVVSPTGNYTAQAVDADQHLDWSDVLQVLASAESQQTSCPICLSEPVAPRMAKCGHIFCLPCLIRFMNTSSSEEEKRPARWRKCPICEDTVVLPEVRPVRFYAGQECPLPRPGDDVVLRLMTRSANSTLALPREGGAEVLGSLDDIPWHRDANVLDYASIMKGTGDYMEDQFDREIEDLLRQEKEDELLFHEDNEWTQKAIKTINAAKDKVRGLGDAEVAMSNRASAHAGRNTELDFYFYTAPPHLYLSPLDIRILKTKYGAFAAFPSTLLPRVEHISTGHVVDDGLRKRAKYLGHLPYGCVISFLECDWTDIVPAEILDAFSEEIERRRKRNRDKATQEERERIQAERIEAAALRGGRRGLDTVDEQVTVRFGTSPSEPGMLDLNEFQPLGSQATTPPNPRPGFSQLSDLSTSPSAPKTVWGTPAIPGEPGMAPIRAQPADDGWMKDADFLESLGAADLAVQMEALGVDEPSNRNHGSAAGGGGGKKKKKQKITLMSTGGRRGT
ncbi:hypothetical protein GQ53DRAFT_749395 [Thozetella sp. PMI_491]|nr:hypothetical protein GQ53DRAFT_749395 [Thozetella sp. PMI_491]